MLILDSNLRRTNLVVKHLQLEQNMHKYSLLATIYDPEF
jgi:hypothetical protein